jgi:hypothetical protein
MVFHQQAILHLPPNHAARSISIYRQSALCNEEPATHVQIVKSWETNKVLTGIPPHVKILVDVAAIRATQEKIIERLYDYERLMSGVTDLFDDRHIGDGELTEARLNTMVANAVAPQFEAINLTLTQAFSHLSQASPACDFGETPYAYTFSNAIFPIRTNSNGMFSRLPYDYEFPQAGAYDCWISGTLVIL